MRVQVSPAAQMNPKIVVIVGPTASGKSSLGVSLAKKFHGEIISADSRQVYKGLDLGTGKITKKEMRGIPHHLLDVANPKKRFTVVEYQKKTSRAIRDIVQKKKLPFVVGGTGFYIDSLVQGSNLPNVPPNTTLRKKLEKKSTQVLFAMLKKKDQQRAKTIDPNNKVRLIRALEIVASLGKVPSVAKKNLYDALYIGINPDKNNLQKNIHKRLVERTKKGMLQEVKKLHEKDLSWKRMEELGLEYKFIALYLQKVLTKQDMLQKLESAILQYSKRQMTWFKRNKDIVLFQRTDRNNLKKIEKLVKNFIFESGS